MNKRYTPKELKQHEKGCGATCYVQADQEIIFYRYVEKRWTAATYARDDRGWYLVSERGMTFTPPSGVTRL